MEREVLAKHIKSGDKHRDLQQKSSQALHRVQRMHAMFFVDGQNASVRLLALVFTLDRIDFGL